MVTFKTECSLILNIENIIGADNFPADTAGTIYKSTGNFLCQ